MEKMRFKKVHWSRIKISNYGMRPKLENLNRSKDEVEMGLSLTLLPCLVIYITILLRFTHILTNKQV